MAGPYLGQPFPLRDRATTTALDPLCGSSAWCARDAVVARTWITSPCAYERSSDDGADLASWGGQVAREPPVERFHVVAGAGGAGRVDDDEALLKTGVEPLPADFDVLGA